MLDVRSVIAHAFLTLAVLFERLEEMDKPVPR
jgi:hypothetical protein